MAWFEHGTSRIYYEDYGTGDPVLLLPGFAGSIQSFSALTETLLGAGYRVISADLPGSGRSQPQPFPYTASYYEDGAHAYSALLQTLAIPSAHLMGFSDGGEFSLLMAALTPAIARSVVTWGAVGVVSDPDGRFREAMYTVVDQPIPPMRPFRDYIIATYGEASARLMTQRVAGAFGDIIEQNGGDISFSKAGSIACRVLLITGEHDFLASPALVSQLAARIASAETLIIEGAGHDPFHIARPEWMAQTILDWLAKHQVVH